MLSPPGFSFVRWRSTVMLSNDDCNRELDVVFMTTLPREILDEVSSNFSGKTGRQGFEPR